MINDESFVETIVRITEQVLFAQCTYNIRDCELYS